MAWIESVPIVLVTVGDFNLIIENNYKGQVAGKILDTPISFETKK